MDSWRKLLRPDLREGHLPIRMVCQTGNRKDEGWSVVISQRRAPLRDWNRQVQLSHIGLQEFRRSSELLARVS